MHRRVLLRRFSPLLALSLSAACALFIPDNPSEPRYNQVVGDWHNPQKNPGSAASRSPSSHTPPSPQSTAPMAVAPSPVAVMDLPPVDPSVQRIAEQRIEAARAVPEENMQVAMGDYPDLHDVPPAARSTGDAATAERMQNVRSELEQNRAAAATATSNLRRDAAAEPSMLSDLPAVTPTVPAPEPVISKPIPQSVPAPPTAAPGPTSRAINAPPMAAATPPNSSYIAALPPPPPVLATVSREPGPIQMDALPMGQVSAGPIPTSNPIQLRAPEPGTPPIMVSSTAAPGSPAMSPGGFDPMANAAAPIVLTPPVRYAGGGAYLAPSRYAYRR